LRRIFVTEKREANKHGQNYKVRKLAFFYSSHIYTDYEINENEMAGLCSTLERKHWFGISIGTGEDSRQVGRLRVYGWIILKWILNIYI
jgi:hypothetical protein